MVVLVANSGWGEGRSIDVRTLLIDVASHLTAPLREALACSVFVVPATDADFVPRIRYRTSPREPFMIQLTARNRRWSQYAYQFSHELCHLLCDYERIGDDNPNCWFHEALCELASVFVLRRMAERWPTNPPYLNWAGYAGALAHQAFEEMTREERQLPAGAVLPEWITSEEEVLRTDPYQRDYNAIVAYALLPVFEACPEGWNSVLHLPTSTGCLRDYIQDWRAAVSDIDRPFVERILQALYPDAMRGRPARAFV